MDCFLAPIKELADYQSIFDNRDRGKGYIQITGCINSQKTHMMYALSGGFDFKIIVFSSEEKANAAYEEYGFLDEKVLYYPAKDLLFYNADIKGKYLFSKRISAVKEIILQGQKASAHVNLVKEGTKNNKTPVTRQNENGMTIIITIDALLDGLPTLDEIKRAVIKIDNQGTLNIDDLQLKLVEIGYERTHQVESPGHFAVRGGIIDIYPFTEENPVRVELWGDEIDSLRVFDSESQRTISNVDEVIIYPAKELESCQEVSFLDYFKGTNSIIFLDDPARLVEKLNEVYNEYEYSFMKREEAGFSFDNSIDSSYVMGKYLEVEKKINDLYYANNNDERFKGDVGVVAGWRPLKVFSVKDVIDNLNAFKGIAFTTLETKVADFKIKKRCSINVRGVNPYHNSFEMLTRDLKKYKVEGYRVVLLSASRSRAKRLAEDLRDYSLNSFYCEDASREVQPGEILVAQGQLTQGYEYPLLKFIIISESDIFGKHRKKKKKRRVYSGERIQDFSSLKVGDYVVHENHGLGVYRGIEKIEVDSIAKDYMKISYADGGNLFIPATHLDVIQRYAGVDAKKPKLNRLGTNSWARTKSQVKGAVNEIAKDLVELYARRQNKDGYVYEADTVWQKEFEEMFPFEETEDQVEAIEDTKRDMESKKIMDRLICGDVGYGKTEIAIRAAFKAVQENKQVVYLVPTTILAQQHYQTFSQRMRDFPVRIELLCRFRTPAQIKRTLEDLRKGLVDIVIGTHRVLSKDVHYKDLGLLIIDEEQRFGVRHKEVIKKLKESVDVLTMTATPIPRTLHMSLIGIRDLSVLDEAPMDRMPIQTYVTEYQEEVVREAIERELSRGGQIYYVYNRVSDIPDIAIRIQKLVPNAVVAYAHGQMGERKLENVMHDFIEKEIDVLVSTTIVETGLDISNANTMIIHDADRFGLAQLYQLRGRIGRSNRLAYAFLLYKRDKLLREEAEKRLTAIREFTDLGSGIKIAMRDLEIRGAGNLLGAAQSGHMAAVGYDLYSKMLNQAVKELRGEAREEVFNTTIDLNINAYIPNTYIKNEYQKLDVYKRIATIESEEEAADMLDELIDRFGEVPNNVHQLLKIANIKALAKSVYVTAIEQTNSAYKFVMYEKAKVDPGKIPTLIEMYKGRLVFKADSHPYFTYYRKDGKRNIPDYELLELIKKILNDLKVLLD